MEDVEDDVAVVEEDPRRARIALDRHRPPPVRFHRLLDRVGERLRLPAARRGRQDEVVRHRGQALQVEDDDLVGLLVEESVDALLQRGDETRVERGELGLAPAVALGRLPARGLLSRRRGSGGRALRDHVP